MRVLAHVQIQLFLDLVGVVIVLTGALMLLEHVSEFRWGIGRKLVLKLLLLIKPNHFHLVFISFGQVVLRVRLDVLFFFPDEVHQRLFVRVHQLLLRDRPLRSPALSLDQFILNVDVLAETAHESVVRYHMAVSHVLEHHSVLGCLLLLGHHLVPLKRIRIFLAASDRTQQRSSGHVIGIWAEGGHGDVVGGHCGFADVVLVMHELFKPLGGSLVGDSILLRLLLPLTGQISHIFEFK